MSDLHLTECGLDGIKRIPYGMHACHFYRDRKALIDALVPYFIAGLRNNERCIWVTAPPLPSAEAVAGLSAAWRGAGEAIERGALRIVDFDQWYAGGGTLHGVEVADWWLGEEERALAAGYRGLRITGNTSFLKPGDWAGFMEYERIVSERLYGRRIVALCSYSLPGCTARQVIEARAAHGCTLDRPDSAGWQVLSEVGGAPRG